MIVKLQTPSSRHHPPPPYTAAAAAGCPFLLSVLRSSARGPYNCIKTNLLKIVQSTQNQSTLAENIFAKILETVQSSESIVRSRWAAPPLATRSHNSAPSNEQVYEVICINMQYYINCNEIPTPNCLT